LKAELARAISSTYYNATTGTSASIRIATPSTSSTSQALENLLEAIPQVVAQIQDEWDNILSIGIKTSNSVFLPVYSAKLDGRFDPSASATAGAKGDVEMEVEEAVPAPVQAMEKKPKAKEQVKTKAAAAAATAEPRKKSSTIGSGAKKTKQGVLGKTSKVSKTKA
jgi:ribosome biogenesis protein UTP30